MRRNRRSPRAAAALRRGGSPRSKLVRPVLGKMRAPNPRHALSIDGGHAPAVLRIGGIIRMRDLRTLLAIADRRHPGRRGTERDEDVFHRLSAAFAERQVVLSRPALVAMSLDRDADIAIATQPVG